MYCSTNSCKHNFQITLILGKQANTNQNMYKPETELTKLACPFNFFILIPVGTSHTATELSVAQLYKCDPSGEKHNSITAPVCPFITITFSHCPYTFQRTKNKKDDIISYKNLS